MTLPSDNRISGFSNLPAYRGVLIDFKSSMKGLYIVGDGSGISGAIAAEEKGELAAYSILKDLKLIDEIEFENNTSKIIKKLKRYEIFAKGIAKLNFTPKDLINNISENTILCRCEDITKRDIINAVNNGAKNLNQISLYIFL